MDQFGPYGTNLSIFFKTEDINIQTGYGIILPTSRPLIKKLLLQNISNFYQGLQNSFPNQKMELSKQEMEISKQKRNYFTHFQASDQKFL